AGVGPVLEAVDRGQKVGIDLGRENRRRRGRFPERGRGDRRPQVRRGSERAVVPVGGKGFAVGPDGDEPGVRGGQRGQAAEVGGGVGGAGDGRAGRARDRAEGVIGVGPILEVAVADLARTVRVHLAGQGSGGGADGGRRTGGHVRQRERCEHRHVV